MGTSASAHVEPSAQVQGPGDWLGDWRTLNDTDG